MSRWSPMCSSPKKANVWMIICKITFTSKSHLNILCYTLGIIWTIYFLMMRMFNSIDTFLFLILIFWPHGAMWTSDFWMSPCIQDVVQDNSWLMTYSDLSELITRVKCIYKSKRNILWLIILCIKGQTITAFRICKN